MGHSLPHSRCNISRAKGLPHLWAAARPCPPEPEAVQEPGQRGRQLKLSRLARDLQKLRLKQSSRAHPLSLQVQAQDPPLAREGALPLRGALRIAAGGSAGVHQETRHPRTDARTSVSASSPDGQLSAVSMTTR